MKFDIPTRMSRSHCCFALLVLSLTPARSAFGQGVPGVVGKLTGEYLPGEVMVRVRAKNDGLRVQNKLKRFGSLIGYLPQIQTYRLRLPAGTEVALALPRMRQEADFLTVSPHHRVHAVSVPNDTKYADTGQYGLRKMQMESAWPLWNPCRTAVVAILDTGVDSTHNDLKNKILVNNDGTIGFNGFNNTRGNTGDKHSHGTHCSGIAAAQINNGIGVAGVGGWNGNPGSTDTNGVKILPVKVLDDSGSGTEDSVASGLLWAADNGANVISMSLGAPEFSQTIADAVTYAWGKGVVIVAAAGNNGNTKFFYPAYHPNIISVAASTNSTNDSLAGYSNRGTWVTVAAPGDSILSTLPNQGYGTKSGTSMACPQVAGLAAFLMAQNPDLTNQNIRDIIVATVDKYASSPIAPNSGRVNGFKAIKQAGMNVSGLVTLLGSINASQPLTFSFVPVGIGATVIRSVTTQSQAQGGDIASFCVTGIPQGTYRMGVKGSKWLQTIVNVDTNAGPLTGLAVSLRPGDATHDNRVNFDDFQALADAYFTVPGDPLYNADADFNCDNQVNFDDFQLLADYYFTDGDN